MTPSWMTLTSRKLLITISDAKFGKMGSASNARTHIISMIKESAAKYLHIVSYSTKKLENVKTVI